VLLLTEGEDVISNIWTGEWYQKTLEAERLRFGTPHILLLPVTGFLDGASLNSFGSTSAMPLMISLLNYTLEWLAADDSKKVYGFYPDLSFISKAQKKKKDVQKWVKELESFVASKFVEGIKKAYETGIPWVDSKGVEYTLVPVVPFLIADMGEAPWMKGVRDSYKAKRPCHLCLINFGDAHRVIKRMFLRYRSGKKATVRIRKWLKIKR
jgi:hypothetical protein